MTDDERIAKLQQTTVMLGQQITNLDGQLAELRASVHVLRLHAAVQLNPLDPASALASLQNLEQTLSERDPEAQARQKASDMLEALQTWMKGGRQPPQS